MLFYSKKDSTKVQNFKPNFLKPSKKKKNNFEKRNKNTSLKISEEFKMDFKIKEERKFKVISFKISKRNEFVAELQTNVGIINEM